MKFSFVKCPGGYQGSQIGIVNSVAAFLTASHFDRVYHPGFSASAYLPTCLLAYRLVIGSKPLSVEVTDRAGWSSCMVRGVWADF